MPNPTVVRRYGFSSALGNVLNTFNRYRLPAPPIPGNALIIVANVASGRTLTFSDDRGNSYTAVAAATSDGNQKGQIFRCPNIRNAPTEINPELDGGGASWFDFKVLEVAFLDRDGRLDSTPTGATGTSTTPAPGSLTTAVANSLVVSFAINDSGTQTDFTKGTGATLDLVDTFEGTAVEHKVQASPGAVNLGFTLAASRTWINVQAAFLAGDSGGLPPSGPQCVAMSHYRIPSTADPGSDTIQVPTQSGTLLVGQFIGARACTGITDNKSNTWSATSANVGGLPAGNTRNFKVVTPTLGEDTLLTLTTSGAGASPGDTLVVTEWTGLDGNTTVNANATGSENTLVEWDAVSITPTAPNGVIFLTCAEQSHTAIGFLSPAGAVFLSCTNNPEVVETSPWPNDENNTWGVHFNRSAAQQTFRIVATGGAPQAFAASADWFAGPAPAEPQPFTGSFGRRRTRYAA